MVLKGINRIVAQNTGVSVGDVATRFWQRVSVDMQRHMHRALVRRVNRNGGSSDGLGRVVDGVALLEELGL